MISHPEILDGEGWSWIDKIENTCSEATISSPTTDNTAAIDSNSIHYSTYNSVYFPGVVLPTFIHYCQDYIADAYAFHKRDVPTNILHCNNSSSGNNNNGNKRNNNNDNILLLSDPDSLIYSGDLNKLTNVTVEVRHMYLPL